MEYEARIPSFRERRAEPAIINPDPQLSETKGIRLPPLLVLAYHQPLVSAAIRELGLTSVPAWNSRYPIWKDGKGTFALVRTEIGAASTCLCAEQAISLGAEALIQVGPCGGVGIPGGRVVVPSYAYCDEGVSRHYSDHSPVRSARGLYERLLVATGVPEDQGVWTTDAPYRETVSMVEWAKAAGVVAVDMESSALWTVAGYRGVDAASALYTVDSLSSTGAWEAGRSGSGAPGGQEAVLSALLQVL